MQSGSHPGRKRLLYALLATLSLALLVVVVKGYIDLAASDILLRECEWSATAYAWIDADQDGTWDGGELPLEDVVIYVEDDLHPGRQVAQFKTDELGSAYLSALRPCKTYSFSLRAEPPPGFRPTTLAHLPDNPDLANEARRFWFGFYPQGGP